jgi:hypothetical protein
LKDILRAKLKRRGEQVKTAGAREAVFALAVLLFVLGLGPTVLAQGQRPATESQARQEEEAEAARTRYDIDLVLDFDGRSYTGTERVRFVNDGEHPAYLL